MTVSPLSPDKAVVGCVGLGIMGAPAARNMRRAGYGLRLFARRRETLSDFADLPTLESPKHLAAECDVVVVNVSDTPDVEEVALGDNGIIAGMRPGGMVIDMSTIAPAAARRIAGRLREKNIAFLDAPVSGGQQGAIDGTLTMMVGGEEDAFARALPLLQAMAKSITRIGDSGAGQVAKMCNQIIIGATIEGVAEAMDLAQKNGANAEAIRGALLGGFAGSKVLEIHGKRMLDDNFAPGFKTALHQKDMRIALQNGEENSRPLPAAKLFSQRLQQLIAQNDGELDSAAAYKIVCAEAEGG